MKHSWQSKYQHVCERTFNTPSCISGALALQLKTNVTPMIETVAEDRKECFTSDEGEELHNYARIRKNIRRGSNMRTTLREQRQSQTMESVKQYSSDEDDSVSVGSHYANFTFKRKGSTQKESQVVLRRDSGMISTEGSSQNSSGDSQTCKQPVADDADQQAVLKENIKLKRKNCKTSIEKLTSHYEERRNLFYAKLEKQYMERVQNGDADDNIYAEIDEHGYLTAVDDSGKRNHHFEENTEDCDDAQPYATSQDLLSELIAENESFYHIYDTSKRSQSVGAEDFYRVYDSTKRSHSNSFGDGYDYEDHIYTTASFDDDDLTESFYEQADTVDGKQDERNEAIIDRKERNSSWSAFLQSTKNDKIQNVTYSNNDENNNKQEISTKKVKIRYTDSGYAEITSKYQDMLCQYLGLNQDPLEPTEPVWKSHLYQLQLQAPKPTRVVCHTPIPDRPLIYGKEFHGAISREEAEELVMKSEGSYLTRESQRQPGTYALTFRFNNAPRNYRLYYDAEEKMHLVGEKQFETINDLVADGLITLYIDYNAKDYIQHMTADAHRHSNKQQDSCDGEERLNTTTATTTTTTSSSIKRSPQRATFKASEVEKEHNFKTQTFYGPHWCGYCRNFMWGLKAQGVRCQDCSFDCHRQCSVEVPNNCSPDKKLVRRTFGVDLTTFIKAHDLRRPPIVEACVNEIEKRGMEEEGLYRIPGFADDITYLQNCVDKEGVVIPDFSEKKVSDVNVLCGLLKLYFRLLPIPIITFDLYSSFVKSVKQHNERIEQVQSLGACVKKLPPAHYETLKYLCRHLQRATKYKDKNLMSAENMAIVFGPTLMRPPDHLLMASVSDIPFQKTIVTLLIEEQDVLFEN